MTKKYTIEMADLDDILAIARLQLRSEWAHAQRRIQIINVDVAEPVGTELTMRAAHVYDYMTRNAARCIDVFAGFKAVSGDNITGCVFTVEPEGVDYIDYALKPVAIEGLNVDLDYWRQGIATSLLHRAMNHAAQQGFDHAILQVADDNHEARGMYEREGFTLIADRWDAYRGPKGDMTAVTYQRSLI